MSKTAEEIGMIAGGIALAMATGPLGAVITNLVVLNGMIGMGLTTAVAGVAGLLSPGPQDPSNIAPQGQLPVQTPNPLWRILYGIFQFAGSLTFTDGPMLDWTGTLGGQPCDHQYIHRVQTLVAHQICGFLAVVIDGQTFNFGTDLQLLTSENNNNNQLGPPGMWGFIPTESGGFNKGNNPWQAALLFAFDCGDPGNAGQPFPYLLAGSAWAPTGGGGNGNPPITGSSRWTPTCLQRGRAKVHILIHYRPSNNQSDGPANGAPQPYPLGSGRIPVIEFKIMGRIVQDYRIVTAWQASGSYPQHAYVLYTFADGAQWIFVQQNGGGASGAAAPNFAGTAIGSTLPDGTCLWLNCGAPVFAAGSGLTNLNVPGSNKLGGPGGTILIADAWQGGAGGYQNQVIEAPIGWLQSKADANLTGANRPNFEANLTLGGVTVDGATSWTCLGRSPYATCLPDADGTQNHGGISNPALAVADHLQTSRYSFGMGAKLTPDGIDSVIAAANLCDEPQPIEVFADGTTLYERNYACNGCFESSTACGDVLKSLALSMAGRVVPPGDCWRVYAGSYVPPEIVLGEGDARGAIKSEWRLSLRDACNGVKGQYIPGFLPINPLGPLASSPASPSWKKVDFPAVQIASYIAEDGGAILWKEITLDFTISLWMAQRIAWIVLQSFRRQVTVSLPAKATPLAMLAGDTVTFARPRWQSANPPAPTAFFASHIVARTEMTDGGPAVGVDLVLRQTDAGVYEFPPPVSPTDFGGYSPYGQTGVGAGNVE